MRTIARWSILGVLALTGALAPQAAGALPGGAALAEAGAVPIINAQARTARPGKAVARSRGRAGRLRRVDTAPAYARAATRQRARIARMKARRPLRVAKRGRVIAVGKPTQRFLSPTPVLRGADIAGRRAARARTPAFTSRAVAFAGRHAFAPHHRGGSYAAGHRGVDADVGQARVHLIDGPRHRGRQWRPSQRDMRNVGALAGAAWAGEVVADDALNGAYDTPPSTGGSRAVYNRPHRPGRSYSVSSDEAGGPPSGVGTGGLAPGALPPVAPPPVPGQGVVYSNQALGAPDPQPAPATSFPDTSFDTAPSNFPDPFDKGAFLDRDRIFGGPIFPRVVFATGATLHGGPALRPGAVFATGAKVHGAGPGRGVIPASVGTAAATRGVYVAGANAMEFGGAVGRPGPLPVAWLAR